MRVTPSSRSRPIRATRARDGALVHPAGDLVQQEQPRAGGHGARHFQPLPLAGRELAGEGGGLVAEAHELEAAVGLRAGGPGGRGAQEGAHHHVLPHGHAAEGAELLEGAADAATVDLIGPEARDGLAGEADVAAVGPVEAGDDVEERRLAGAVRPDDPHDLAGGHVEGDRLVGHQAAEALGDGADLQQRRPLIGSPPGVGPRASAAVRPIGYPVPWGATAGAGGAGRPARRVSRSTRPMSPPGWNTETSTISPP